MQVAVNKQAMIFFQPPIRVLVCNILGWFHSSGFLRSVQNAKLLNAKTAYAVNLCLALAKLTRFDIVSRSLEEPS